MIEIREVNIEEVLKVHKNIPEFYDTIPKKEYFENRYKNKEKLIIVAYYNDVPAGYKKNHVYNRCNRKLK